MRVSQSIQQYIPSREQVVEKLSISLPQIVHNTSKVALPAIALFALANIPGADGGPLAYAACVIGCAPIIGGVAGPAAIACMNWCLLLLPLPGP